MEGSGWRRCRLTVAVMLVSVCLPAQAIVNIERLRIEEPEQGWSGTLRWGIDGDRGNTDQLSFSTALSAYWRRDRHQVMGFFSREFGRSRDVKNKDRTFFHGRYIRKQTARWSWEGYVQRQSDQFRRLEQRSLIGGGGRFQITRTDQTAQTVGVGVFRSREAYDQTVVASQQKEIAWRLSTYWVFRWQLAEHLTLANTLYLQPKVDRTGDVRLAEQLSLVAELTEHLELNLTLDALYDSDPPRLVAGQTALEKADVSYKTRLAYHF